MKRHSFLFAIVFAIFACFVTFAESTPIENLYEYKLKNGLSLFVAENHNVPLTYIEVAVRCGAYTQEKETAGLFHLYEHMMFKGNALYKSAAEVTNALSNLGVADWNGTTDLECVNYYFTVPSGKTRDGLEFWSAAIRSPLLNKNELENEKKVVLSEINGNFSSPERIASSYASKMMFSDSPWKMDPSGSSDVVQNASVKSLKNIQKTFYVPNNSAVFVGGDVNPDEVYKMVEEIFGDWKRAKSPFEKNTIQHSKTPFTEPKFAVMPFEKCSKEIAQISVTYRGPDAAFDRNDTYPLDVFTEILSNPAGVFTRSVVSDTYIGVPTSDYVSAGYYTRKTCGQFSVTAIVTMPEEELAERAKYFSNSIPALLNEEAENISESEIEKTVRKIEDSNIFTNETAEGLLRTVRFWWITCDEDYFFTYNEKMGEVTKENIASLVEKYIEGKNPLVLVYVNPDIYEEEKQAFFDAGFEVVSKENAFWFNNN